MLNLKVNDPLKEKKVAYKRWQRMGTEVDQEIGLFAIVCENNVICPKYIHIYAFWGGRRGSPPFTFCLLFKKTEKV